MAENSISKDSRNCDEPSWELDESVGFLLSDTARFVKRLLYADVAAYGVRGGYWFFLRALWLEDGCSQRELAVRLGLVEPTVLEMVRAMEKDGLVERRRDKQDGRKRLVFLTDHAKELQPELMQIAIRNNEKILSALSVAEQILLKQNLKAIRNALSAELEADKSSDRLKASATTEEHLSDKTYLRQKK